MVLDRHQSSCITAPVEPSSSTSTSTETDLSAPSVLSSALSPSAGVPGSGAFLYIPERSVGGSMSDLRLRHKLQLADEGDGEEGDQRLELCCSRSRSGSSSASSEPASPSAQPASSVPSADLTPTRSSASASSARPRMTTTTSLGRENARDADVLGKILGWRHSTINRHRHSPTRSTHQPHDASRPSQPSRRRPTTRSPAFKSPTVATPALHAQELPQIFRSSNLQQHQIHFNPLSTNHLPSSQSAHSLLDQPNLPSSSAQPPSPPSRSSNELNPPPPSATTMSLPLGVILPHPSAISSTSQPESDSSGLSQLSSSSSPTQPDQHQAVCASLPTNTEILSQNHCYATAPTQAHYNTITDHNGLGPPINLVSQSALVIKAPLTSIHLASSDTPPSMSIHDRLAEAERLNLKTDDSLGSPHRFSLPNLLALSDPKPQASHLSTHNPIQELSPSRRRTMHGVASNESIRTAKPSSLRNQLLSADPSSGPHPRFTIEAPLGSAPLTKRKRFEDITVFDLFHQSHRHLGLTTYSPDLVRSALTMSTERSTTPSRAHLPSQLPWLSTEPARNRPSTSSHMPLLLQLDDDPRYVIWTQTQSGPRQRYISRSPKKRTMSNVDRQTLFHSPSNSTSQLTQDQASHRLTHISNNSTPSVTTPSTTGSNRRWSRAAKYPPSSALFAHHSYESSTPSPPQLNLSTLVPQGSTHLSSKPMSIDETSQRSTVDMTDEKTNRLDGEPRLLVAATIERWVAELTTVIDTVGLMEFFLTYRAIMSSLDLLKLLSTRFEWSITFKSEIYFNRAHGRGAGWLGIDGRAMNIDAEEEARRRIVKVRTFVMIRYWILNHFEDDFLKDDRLRMVLIGWMSGLGSKIRRIQRRLESLEQGVKNDGKAGGDQDLKILNTLRSVLRDREGSYQPSNIFQHGSSSQSTSGSSSLMNEVHQADDDDDFRDPEEQHAFSTRTDPDRTITKLDRRGRTSFQDEATPSANRPRPRSERSRSIAKSSIGYGIDRNVSKSDLRLCEIESEVTTDELSMKSARDEFDFDEIVVEERLMRSLELCFQVDTKCPELMQNQLQLADLNSATLPSSRYFSRKSAQVPSTHIRPNETPRHRITKDASGGSSPVLNSSSSSGHHVGFVFPQHHNPFHRYFTSTMGTLGRFKRMINNRSGVNGGMSELESPEMVNQHHEIVGDLLCVKGGLERYLSFFEMRKEDPSRVDSHHLGPDDLEEIETRLQVDQQSGHPRQRFLNADPAVEDEDNRREELFGVIDQRDPDGSTDDLNLPSPHMTRYDEGFDSQLSLSSSVSNTTCTSQSISSDKNELIDSRSDPSLLYSQGEDCPTTFGGPGKMMGLGFEVIEPADSASLGELTRLDRENFVDEAGLVARKILAGESRGPEHSLHESLSNETIKSDGHPMSLINGGGPNAMGVFKKKIQQRFGTRSQEVRSIRHLEIACASQSLEDRLMNSKVEVIPERIEVNSNEQPTESYAHPIINKTNLDSSGKQIDRPAASAPRLSAHDQRPDSVQLDDLDLSESDEDWPTARRLRRLPGAGDLKQAIAGGRKSFFNLKSGFMKAGAERDDRWRLSTETSNSSIGTRRVPSMAGSMFRRSKLSHALFSQRVEEPKRVEPNVTEGIPVVANFVADGLESDDDEPGDVEAALRRLEGVIDADREREKARKVELQMMKSVEASRQIRSGAHTSVVSSISGSSFSQTDYDDDDDDDEDPDVHDDSIGDGVAEEEEEGRKSNAPKAESEDAQEELGFGDDPPAGTKKLSPSALEGGARRSITGTSSTSSVRLDIILTGRPLSALSSSAHYPKASSTKTHIRFFASQSRIKSEVEHNDNKLMAGSLRQVGFRSSKTTDRRMSRKGSLHKLFAGNTAHPNHLNKSGASSQTLRLDRSTHDSATPPLHRVSVHQSVLPALELPPVHRSFLLDCRTEILARQFCLIERDLLGKITWQELLLSRWQDDRAGTRGKKKRMGMVAEEVNCWETFMKQRAREKMRIKAEEEKKKKKKESSDGQAVEELDEPVSRGWTEIKTMIMRFNLTCNWVASEIVLTISLEERVLLLGKFIRLAFKCYRQNNFQTLTQIIHGLQTPYVERLKKTWSKLGIWESRMFRDLKEFTSHTSNFKSMRNMQDNLLEQQQVAEVDTMAPTSTNVHHRSTAPHGYLNKMKPGSLHGGPQTELNGSRTSHSHNRNTGQSVGCIPFLGLYLRDLTINDELPTYLDPSEPSQPAEIEPKTGEVIELNKPEMFAKNVEEGRPIYPLINIHKLRMYSKTVLKIIKFQEHGEEYNRFETDEKLFLVCLRIKSLDSDQMRWLSKTCEP